MPLDTVGADDPLTGAGKNTESGVGPGGGGLPLGPGSGSTGGTSICFDEEGRIRPCGEGETGRNFFDSDQILELLQQLGGSGGGGGGGSSGRSELRDLLTQLVSRDATEGAPSVELDPRFAELFGQLQAETEAQTGILRRLDPAARADFEAQERSRLSDIDEVARQQQQELLTRLFAGGTQQSTFAASQAGEFGAATARARDAARGDVAAQRLGAREFITTQGLQSLQLRFQALESEQAGELQELGINADLLRSERDRNAGLLSSVLGFESGERQASIAASASRYAARLGFVSDFAQIGAQREAGFLNRDVALRGQDTDVRIANIGAQSSRDANRRRERSSTLGTLASLGIGIAGLFGPFSDRRLKYDITTIGYLNGIRIVTFRYLGKLQLNIGVIAQEVMGKYPDVVGNFRGAFTVDYRKLGAYSG